MRRVGNNWRITLRMHYKKKARVDVLEHMVLHGIANLVVSLTYHQKRTLQEGHMAENETVLELYQLEVQRCQLNETFIVSLMCRQSDTQEGRHRKVKKLDPMLLPVHSSIFCLKDSQKRCSKVFQQEITERLGNLTEVTANTGTNGGY